MNSITVKLKIQKSRSNKIYLPNHILQKLNLKHNQSIPIYFGLTSSKVATIRGFNSHSNIIVITSSLMEKLLLPYKKDIMIKKEQDGLRIGPIIGIYTTDYTGKKFSNDPSNKHPFGFFFKNLLSSETKYPVYYFVFTPEEIDWGKKTIHGYFYRKNYWQKITVPFPDVVYNRIPNRSVEKKPSISNFKQTYLNFGGKMFNPGFFNKWDMYQILVQEPDTVKYIPETYMKPSFSIFKDMLKRHSIVYLKPANGSLGLGIYKVNRKSNSYLIQYRVGSKNFAVSFKKITSAYKYIFQHKKPQYYLIQQGINLIKYHQNPVDFRIQLHKDSLNQWQVIAIGAKVAGKGSVTTHLRTGGKMIDSLNYLEKVYGNNTYKILREINNMAILIARTVEEKLGSPVGELGLDVGIDTNNRIWLFEVNSKPGRSIFKHPSLKDARNKSSNKLLEYAMYLSRFTTKHSPPSKEAL
ncbi:hypothetical protein BHF71_06345 [Vulcanibacillus modesticaldus]|uniref:ATP-grasp domain-containing protein n=1 Tax=Vulcanibacillus modesticaldus TaxID=337097 RepID=A0A1D2YWM7_9BACI|nr:YheC/YheD family protein [Vulcanibacillus modesticaldus]OEG00062.1 hypothetical protein BHF71_06345 [Vulcanibacillus modesticaldus]